MVITEKYRRRFETKVAKGTIDVCWEWLAGTDSAGYGLFSIESRTVRAHRVSYLLYRGMIPKDLSVCHTCDNRRCVNPSHLWLGTKGDNNSDRHDKGRDAWNCGTAAGNVTLDDEKVTEIRKEYSLGGQTQQRLASKFGTSQSNVSRICSGKTWPHLSTK